MTSLIPTVARTGQAYVMIATSALAEQGLDLVIFFSAASIFVTLLLTTAARVASRLMPAARDGRGMRYVHQFGNQ